MKKAISVVIIVAGALVLLSVATPMIIGIVIEISAEALTHSSVGIIGGADGPTAIVIAETSSTGGIIIAVVIGVLLIAAGIWGLRKMKK